MLIDVVELIGLRHILKSFAALANDYNEFLAVLFEQLEGQVDISYECHAPLSADASAIVLVHVNVANVLFPKDVSLSRAIRLVTVVVLASL